MASSIGFVVELLAALGFVPALLLALAAAPLVRGPATALHVEGYDEHERQRARRGGHEAL